jgi:pimeloyl-ACP methyl ester carboxylesterase
MKAIGSLLAVAAACGLVLAAIYLAQDRLLYFPARDSVERLTGGGLSAWPSAQEFRGLAAEPQGVPRGTVVVFHGNAGHAGHRGYYVRALVPLGLRVILAEYPGYGPRPGAVGEASLVGDAGATIALAHRLYGGPVLVLGESLGAAVAAGAAGAHPEQVSGVLLITPWDRLAHVASHHYPWLPVRWLLRDQYDSGARLASFPRPVVIVVAERDTIVPARFGVALHSTLRGPSHLLTIPASGHNDWPERVDAGWWRGVITTLLGNAD